MEKTIADEREEQRKRYYLAQIARCDVKVVTDRKNAPEWKMARDVYRHLSECSLSHSMRNDGREKCTWGANTYSEQEERVVSY